MHKQDSEGQDGGSLEWKAPRGGAEERRESKECRPPCRQGTGKQLVQWIDGTPILSMGQ